MDRRQQDAEEQQAADPMSLHQALYEASNQDFQETLEDMTTTDHTKNAALYAALAAAQEEMRNPGFDSENPAFRGSRYASLAAVRDAVIPVMSKHGIAVVQELQTHDQGVAVLTHLYHKSGGCVTFGPFAMRNEKNNAHGAGSAATYARRYSLQAIAGVAADEDDDGNTAVEVQTPEQQQAAYEAVVARYQDTITVIKDYIADGVIDAAAECWYELPRDVQISLWRAPSKGGCFTTAERKTIKDEFRNTIYGEAAHEGEK